MRTSPTNILFLLGFAHLSSGDKVFRSDYTYVDAARGWLKYQESPANWQTAKLRCYNEGATLASPHPQLKKAMVDFMKAKGVTSPVFTGINALISKGDYHSIEGVHISEIPIDWAKGEPDNYNDNEECLVIKPDGNGTMADVACINSYPYICYKSENPYNRNSEIDPASTPGDNFFRIDYKYIDLAGGWLKFQRIPANWREAKLRCHLEGAVLASPLHQSLKDSMTDFMFDTRVTTPVFTGINALFSKGDYYSIEGFHISEIPIVWAKGEPDNYRDNEECLIMKPDGSMADVACNDPYPYICYKKSEHLYINNCGTTDPEYKKDWSTGSCYKMHRRAQVYMLAHMTCTAEGGYLAIINSPTESEVLKEIYKTYPENTMIGKFWGDVAFIGFYRWNETSDFFTLHGTTLAQAGFSKFSGGEPNNFPPGEYCGAMYRWGLLDDLWCWKKHPFICEKKPSRLIVNPYVTTRRPT